MNSNGLRLWPSPPASQVRGEQRNRLLMAELALLLRSQVFLFEPQARPIEQGFDSAFGHFEGLGDLPVAHILQFARIKPKAVLFGQTLRHLPDLPARLV